MNQVSHPYPTTTAQTFELLTADHIATNRFKTTGHRT